MKVVIVGCTHAGTIAATQILNAHPDTEVVIMNGMIVFLPFLWNCRLFEW